MKETYTLYTILLTIIYLSFLFLFIFKKKISSKCNHIFFLIISFCYVYFIYACYESDLLSMISPIRHLSETTYLIVVFSFIMPKKIRMVINTAVSCLSISFFVAAIGNLISNYQIGLPLIIETIIGTILHSTISLYGIYLIKTNQTYQDNKRLFLSNLLYPSLGIIFLIINLIFKTSIWELNMYGEHSIYDLVLTDNSYLSALIYFSCLIGLILLGILFNKLLLRKKNKN